MNVFDFDKTIYDGDSSVDFTIFCYKNKPSLIKFIPRQIRAVLYYRRKIITKVQMKETLFSYLAGVDDIDDKIEEFWNVNLCKIKNFYIDIKQPDDIVISASPEFLLRPICKKIGITNLIASNVDLTTGRFISKNCYGEEKAKRFIEIYKDVTIDNFFSDSLSDAPLAKMAKNAFLVKKERIIIWPL